jgi:O-phospho-L-seryl-tRNASec:L-selenocysteinyl-tRNA synthase
MHKQPPGGNPSNQSHSEFENLASTLVKSTYVKQGVQSLRTRHNKLLNLLTHKKIPKQGLDDATIEYVVQELSVMDSNNFPGNVGVGEREGRVYSSLVARRHYGLSHGIGRSGDIAEQQPKAAGSSIIYKLTNSMACHALELAGFQKPATALVLPLATGMTLAMCLLTLRSKVAAAADSDAAAPKYVIWSRIDQKSCFKSIITAGLIPLIVDHVLDDSSGSSSGGRSSSSSSSSSSSNNSGSSGGNQRRRHPSTA